MAARRARSTLRTFRGMFQPAPRQALDASLRAYAARLGQVRDLQVLGGVLAEHSPGSLAAPWAAAEVQRELAAAWQQLQRELVATDHHPLADEMASVLLTPPRKIDLAKRVRRAGRTVERHLATAGDDAERLHAARKAAKRARYAAEATGHASRATRYKELQDALGRHHDLIVAAAWIEAATVPDALRDAAEALVARLRADADRTRSAAVL